MSNISTQQSPEDRLAGAGIEIPPAPGPLGAYAPWIVTGSLLMTSGQFPFVDGKLAYEGRIGDEVSPEDGYQAYRLAALNAIAQLKSAAGSLSRIKRIVRLEGTMQVASGFRDGPVALNGASDLINEVFAERGRHTRMIYTNPEMPLNSPVLLVLFAEIEA
ncbi:MAG: RidA family protein [Hyphomonas sp.]|nr:RidA family protein [Hyphomonas sp.]